MDESTPRITVWWCDKCGYWRQEKMTAGVHVTTDPESPSGKMLIHALRPREFVAVVEAK